jgi:hypothetical protein
MSCGSLEDFNQATYRNRNRLLQSCRPRMTLKGREGEFAGALHPWGGRRPKVDARRGWIKGRKQTLLSR